MCLYMNVCVQELSKSKYVVKVFEYIQLCYLCTCKCMDVQMHVSVSARLCVTCKYGCIVYKIVWALSMCETV